MLFYILDIIASLTGSLLPALVLAYLGRGHIKHYLYTPRQKKTSFFDSFLLVVFGLCGCVVVNMLCTMLESYLPETDHKVYLTFAGTIRVYQNWVASEKKRPLNEIVHEIVIISFGGISRINDMYGRKNAEE